MLVRMVAAYMVVAYTADQHKEAAGSTSSYVVQDASFPSEQPIAHSACSSLRFPYHSAVSPRFTN